jgi:type IV secretory pathway component VirB8
VPIGIYILAKYLERKFGVPKSAVKVSIVNTLALQSADEVIPPYTALQNKSNEIPTLNLSRT